MKDLPRGEMLYFEGDPVGHVLLVIAGFVKLTRIGPGGAEVIVRLGIPGDVIGAPDLFCAGRHGATAQTFRPCRAMIWEARAFALLVERFPALHRNLVQILAEHLLELEERFREVATERVGPRLARQLARLQRQIGRPVGGFIEIGLSREELAQMTGTTLFTVSRLLSSWEASGMVRLGRQAVTICDLNSLREISGHR